MRGRGSRAGGILVLLPDGADARDRVLSAAAALVVGDDEIILAGQGAILSDAEATIAKHFQADRPKHIRTLALNHDRSALSRLLARRSPALIVLSADDMAERLGDTRADILLVR
jgi:hypothetical protein